jgi:hypothetical protein
MSDLRTRIAAVIRQEVPCHPPAADRIADAVIRELEPELNRHDSGCVCDRCWFGTASGMSFEGEADDES